LTIIRSISISINFDVGMALSATELSGTNTLTQENKQLHPSGILYGIVLILAVLGYHLMRG
jgi:hypothetical protein